MAQQMQARPTAAAAQRPANLTPFIHATTRTRQNLTDQAFSGEGQQKTQDLFATGYAAYLKVQVYGKITTGTSAAGTWAWNWPYNLLQRIALRSNAGFEFYNTEGWMNLPVQKYHRLGFDPSVPASPLTGYTSATLGAPLAIQQAPAAGAALVSSTVYPVLVNYLIPIVSHPDLRAGLLPLQNNATRVTLYTTLGTAISIAGAAATFGVGATINLTQRTQLEFFSLPAAGGAQPDLSFIHRIIQDTAPWTASGDQYYRVPVNGVVLRAWEQFRNAGVPQKHFGTANDPTTQQFNNVTVRYAASQNPEIYDMKHMLYQHRLDYVTDLSDGLFCFDFASGAGSIEQGVSARDAYNTRALTEFLTIVNTTVAPAGGSTIEVLRQELQPRRAA